MRYKKINVLLRYVKFIIGSTWTKKSYPKEPFTLAKLRSFLIYQLYKPNNFTTQSFLEANLKACHKVDERISI